MPQTPSATSFLSHLVASQLVEPHVLDEARSLAVRLSATQVAHTRLLGRLTRWQAGCLLAGREHFHAGQYRLLELLGRGGMGVVYKAEHFGLKRVAAVKVLAPRQGSLPLAVSRFHREIRSIARLDHPGCVRAYDAGEVGPTHYLAMEYVDGPDLRMVLESETQLSIRWVCECIRQVASGLQHAHDLGIVHRDIKPSNLLVRKDTLRRRPIVKIADFGLARAMQEAGEDPGITQIGRVAGTPDYMAPEQAEHRDGATPVSDLFSLGCTMFHLLTGRVPYAGATAHDRISARIQNEAPRAGEFHPGLPEELEAIIARLLARDPGARFRSAGQLARVLAPFGMGSGFSSVVTAMHGKPRVQQLGSAKCGSE